MNTDTILSYANRRWTIGNVYNKLGTYIDETRPNYFYYKNGILEGRQKYQKHKLAKLLNNYNPELSESENMDNNGYKRIYDAGNYKYLF